MPKGEPRILVLGKRRLRFLGCLESVCQFAQGVPHLAISSLPQAFRPLLLQPAKSRARDTSHLFAARGHADKTGTAIETVGSHLHVSVPLKVLDEVRHRLLCHLRALGELRLPGAAGLEVLEHDE